MKNIRISFYIAIFLLIAINLPSISYSKRINQDLIDAAIKGDTARVKELTTQNADTKNDINTGDLTAALMLATFNDHNETVKFLIEKGADVNGKMNNGKTALMLAAGQGHVDIVKLLLDKGADVNAKTNNGETALIPAVFKGDTNIIKLLLDRGVDVNAEFELDMSGAIPEAGAPVYGLVTALDIAKIGNNPEIIKLIEQAKQQAKLFNWLTGVGIPLIILISWFIYLIFWKRRDRSSQPA